MFKEKKKIQSLENRLFKTEEKFKDFDDRLKSISALSISSKMLGLSNKASEYKTKILTKWNEVKGIDVKEIEDYAEQFAGAYNNIETATKLASEIKDWSEDAGVHSQTIQNALEEVERLKTDLEAKQTAGVEFSNKISNFHSKANDFVTEIKELRDEVLGYDYEDDETQDEKHVDGLKEQLEQTYSSIKQGLDDAKHKLDVLLKGSVDTYNDFIKSRKEEYQALNKKVKDLLPDALTGGLSHVYAAKRRHEELVRKSYQKSFTSSIIILTAITLIPFCFGTYLIWLSGKNLEEILVILPSVVICIVPLYVPCFWWAFSANMKEKLSKRLVEEYLHKESLTKTFQGLAREIESIGDKDVHEDLRTKLLYNLLEVSAENPGKLILNYNRSDNPIFEAIGKSHDLIQSLEKVGKIPGINILINTIKRAREKKDEEYEKDVDAGLKAVDAEKTSEENT